jgi:pimeloyl-ACP methyl ester carboxylesterase
VAADRRGDAVALFMTLVGVPAEQIEGMRQAPMWAQLEALAPTLVYDAAVLGDDRSVPIARAARITVPALVMNGGASYPFMRGTAEALARAMPDARYRELEGETHDVTPKALAPVLIEGFQAPRRRREAGKGREAAAA